MSDRLLGLLLCLLGSAMFASTGIFAKMAMDGGLDPTMVAAVRTYGGALLLLPFVLRARRGYTRAMLLPVLIYALIGIFASQGLYFEAISRMDVAIALVISYLAPLPVALYQRLRAGEALPAYAYAAMVAAIAGLAVAVLGSGDVGGVSATGLVIAFACMATFAIMIIVGPRQPHGVGPFARAGAPLLVAAVAWFAVCPVWSVPWDRMGDAVHVAGRVDLTLPLWFTIAWTIVIGAALGFVVILAGTSRVGAGTASMVGMVEPVFGALLAWVLLGQGLSAIQSAGIAATVVAVGVVERARVRSIHAVELPDALAPLADGDPR